VAIQVKLANITFFKRNTEFSQIHCSNASHQVQLLR